MRLRNDFIELLHSGELPPDLKDWMQLEPDDFFYIEYEQFKTNDGFIKSIEELLMGVKFSNSVVNKDVKMYRRSIRPFYMVLEILITLKNENIDSRKVHFVGNCMIDSIKRIVPKARVKGKRSKKSVMFVGNTCMRSAMDNCMAC